MSQSWDDLAADWDSDESVIAYAEKAFETLHGELDLNGLRVFDFGCGTGLLTARIAQQAETLVALDSSAGMVSLLEQKHLANVTALCANLSHSTIASTPALQQRFDLIVASSVLAFVPDRVATLSLLETLLAPGGLLVQWDWMAVAGESEFGLDEQDIARSFAAAGLKTQSISVVFSHKGTNGEAPVLMGVAVKPESTSD